MMLKMATMLARSCDRISARLITIFIGPPPHVSQPGIVAENIERVGPWSTVGVCGRIEDSAACGHVQNLGSGFEAAPQSLNCAKMNRDGGRRRNSVELGLSRRLHPAGRQLGRSGNPMAHNTKVSADADAPPVTQILADFVASHPSRGWDAS